MDSQEATLIAAVLAFVASILAVIASIYNARLRRYASERWWERKADAYAAIIEALADQIYYYDKTVKAEGEAEDLSTAAIADLLEHWQRGQDGIEKAITTGAFLISEPAEQVLVDYWGRVESHISKSDWLSDLTADYEAARACRQKIITLARQDLNLGKPTRAH